VLARQRRKLLDGRFDLRIQHHRRRVDAAAMSYAVTDGVDLVFASVSQ